MLWKTVFVLAALAAPAFAEEPSNCTRAPGGYHNVTSIIDDKNFCTMLPPFGTNPVAPSEACANSYCFGDKYTANTSDYLVGPKNFILSSWYTQNVSAQYTQITGCIDSAAWGLNPTDDGGQMDSHGWQYHCANAKKFVSLLEPATNTFCIRCCNGTDVDINCDTSHSTKGCWNLVPGQYTTPDGLACKPPVGSPNSTATATLPATTSTATATVSVPGGGSTGVPGTGSTSAGSTQPSSKPSAASHFSSSIEMIGLVAAAALAIASAF
ncbi:hypothetical protein EDD11_001408 [Mortierella claussenii]|nr:hypothetical protein EDD11_001408 [Mortierella claussenii]